MCGTAAAASSRSTVMRTSSEPARASAATCRAVPPTSAVSVLVIDCTTIGRAAADAHVADVDGNRLVPPLRGRGSRSCSSPWHPMNVRAADCQSTIRHESRCLRHCKSSILAYSSRPVTSTRPPTTSATASAKARVNGSSEHEMAGGDAEQRGQEGECRRRLAE